MFGTMGTYSLLIGLGQPVIPQDPMKEEKEEMEEGEEDEDEREEGEEEANQDYLVVEEVNYEENPARPEEIEVTKENEAKCTGGNEETDSKENDKKEEKARAMKKVLLGCEELTAETCGGIPRNEEEKESVPEAGARSGVATPDYLGDRAGLLVREHGGETTAEQGRTAAEQGPAAAEQWTAAAEQGPAAAEQWTAAAEQGTAAAEPGLTQADHEPPSEHGPPKEHRLLAEHCLVAEFGEAGEPLEDPRQAAELVSKSSL